MAELPDPHTDLGGYVLGLLEPEEATAFEAHVATCDECGRAVDELRHVPDLLAQATPRLDVPSDLEERTFAAVERAAQQDLAPEAGRRRQPTRRRRTVEVRKVLSVAAVVLVAGFGTAIVRETAGPSPAVAQVVELSAPGGGAAVATARVRATTTGGTIEMDVEGLTPPPQGTFFECWLVAADGDTPDRPERVSVGTFSVDESGRASVRWDFKADIAKFPRMGVTLEPDDGNPVQTTDRVLAGTRLLTPPR